MPVLSAFPAAREAVLVLLTLAAAAYMDALGARLPPGGRRLAAALPVLAAFFAAPLLYDRVTEPASTVVAINFPWLSNLTVVSWAMGRGALAQTRPLAGTFAFLLAGAAIPADATSARPGAAPPPAHRSSLLRVGFKLVLLLGAVCAFECWHLPGPISSGLQSVTLYLFISSALEGAALVAWLLSGLPAAPQFDLPMLSSSLGDFWGRRWNTVAGIKHRQAVFEPICEGFVAKPGGSKRRPSHLRRALAVCATFAVSGVVHEMGYFYMTGRLSGRWMLFFSLQGPLLVIEAQLAAAARRAGLRVPRPLAILATLTVLQSLAGPLLFADMLKADLPRRVLHQVWPGAPGGLCTAAARRRV
ncbi:hypothetical protein ABPG77_006971 [Micractinium sp. CCAP 211/92]